MLQLTTRYRRLAAVATFLLLIGCGGHGSGPAKVLTAADGSEALPSANTRASGSVTFQIAWPDSPGGAGRLIPPTTNRIVIHVSGADFVARSVIANRQPAGAPTQVTMSDIPAGLHRWIASEARHVDDPLQLTDAYIIAPTANQMAQGQVLAAGRMVSAVPIYEGMETRADIELQAPAQPPSGVSGVTMAIQQVVADSFPMVLLMDTILDQNGIPLTNLNAANLRLYESIGGGPEQDATIVDVRTANEAATAAAIALVLDCSGSMQGQPIEDLKQACRSFIGNLQPADQAEVLAFESYVNVLQPFTNDLHLLNAAVDGLATGGSTALLDALGRGIEDADAIGGRAAVVGMSDGGDNASTQYTSAGTLIDYATQTGVPVYTVGLQSYDYSPDLLRNLALQTHGLYYDSPTSTQLETIYRSIAGQLAGQVQVTFVSPDRTVSSTPRQLRLAYQYGSFNGEVRATYASDGSVTAPPTVPSLNISGTGEISDSDPATIYHHHYDEVSFTATRNGTIVVRMQRTGASDSVSDPYIEIYQHGQQVAYNDDSGSLDSECGFTATAGTSYVARFQTYDPSDRGTYSFGILETNAAPRAWMPSSPQAKSPGVKTL